MLVVRALRHPFVAVQKVQQYGLGRVVNDLAKSGPEFIRWYIRPVIRWVKIAADPWGYIRRKYYARQFYKTSAFRDYFPENTAFRVAPPGSFNEIDSIIPVARDVVQRFMRLYPTGRM